MWPLPHNRDRHVEARFVGGVDGFDGAHETAGEAEADLGDIAAAHLAFEFDRHAEALGDRRAGGGEADELLAVGEHHGVSLG
jgi:hypothetical protein